MRTQRGSGGALCWLRCTDKDLGQGGGWEERLTVCRGDNFSHPPAAAAQEGAGGCYGDCLLGVPQSDKLA